MQIEVEPMEWSIMDGGKILATITQIPLRLAWAMTIHKSQGSEWSHIAIELPAQSEAALLSRNLLYTAITRSSEKVELIGPESVLRHIAALK
jgi:exodeoxyribonuclease V alpha subunit